MAVVSGPLFSLGASGQVGGSVVFSSWKGRPVVRQLVTPSNPKSAKQTARRAMQRFLSTAWAALSSASKSTFDELAKQGNYSPFNAYIREGQRSWTQFLPPTSALPGGGDTPGTLGTDSWAGGVGQATGTIPLSTVADNWGVAIFAKLGSAPTGLFDEVLWVNLAVASSQTMVVTPLIPGTWHFKARPFSFLGVWGSLGSDRTAVVT